MASSQRAKTHGSTSAAPRDSGGFNLKERVALIRKRSSRGRWARKPGPAEPNPLWDTRIANWERILYEDLQFAPQIQESLQSRGFQSMPLNYQERRIYHWHEELDRRIGLNQVPPEARVAQVLGDFVEA